MKAINLTGQRYGKLTVIKQVESKITPCGQKKRQYLCKCDCGNEVIVQSANLRNSTTKSCGCLKKESSSIVGKRNIQHGQYNTRLYYVWANMKDRCSNKNNKSYKNYGGRGITVCEEWRNSFQSFYDWATANGYTSELTIDRIDVNGNYEPSNCRWANEITQHNNRRDNRYIEYKGNILTIKEAARKYAVPYRALLYRLNSGMTATNAIELKK